MVKIKYAFVGIPSERTMYSRLVNGTDAEIESEIDAMIDVIDCQRSHNPVWMTVPTGAMTFEQAVAEFVKYMQSILHRTVASGRAGD